jgi:hypothetical protein
MVVRGIDLRVGDIISDIDPNSDNKTIFEVIEINQENRRLTLKMVGGSYYYSKNSFGYTDFFLDIHSWHMIKRSEDIFYVKKQLKPFEL